MLDPNATREEELHFRRIDMRGWRRSDGLFELEGRVTDRKPYDFEPWRGGKHVPAGEPIHDMGVRLVFDQELCIHGVETFTEAAPYGECPEGGRALQSLIGLRMTSGWSKEVRSRLGGARSCTHLMELLIPMATTAFQSLSQVNRGRAERVDATGRPLKIDSCYAYGAERELVRVHWPQFHRPKPSDTG
ncbi:TPA: DUF2889 domain-containing protein [Pseudomonas aeruginosa]